MVVTHFCAAQAAEITFRHVRARIVVAVSFLMVNAAHFVFAFQIIPAWRFIGVDQRALDRRDLIQASAALSDLNTAGALYGSRPPQQGQTASPSVSDQRICGKRFRPPLRHAEDLS